MPNLLVKALDKVAENPAFLIILLLASIFVLLSLWNASRGRYPGAAAMYVCFVGVGVLFSRGHDIEHHAARGQAMADQVRDGALNSYLFFGDVGLPVFYYYSAGIYILSVPFELLGLSAEMSVKMVMLSFFVVMAITSRHLFLQLADRGLTEADRQNLSAIVLLVFLSSSYIYFNIVGRSAYPESAVFSLVPAVILALRSDRYLLALAIVCLQIAMHPPVIPQAAVAVIMGYIATSSNGVLKGLRKIVPVYGGAVLLTIPAWYFALRDRDLILGVEGLPIRFIDTFVPFLAFLNPLNPISPGPYYFALLVLAAATFGLGNGRARVLLTAAAVLLFLQTTWGQPITSQIPLADMGLFIWRWTFVVVFLGVVWFAITWKVGERTLLLRIVILVSIFHSVLVIGSTLRPSTLSSSLGIEEYFTRASATNEFSWGRSEFYPSYPPDAGQCAAINTDSFRKVEMSEAWTGLRSDASVAIYRGALAGLRYDFGTTPAQVLGCGDTLFVIHPEPGTELDLAVQRSVLVNWPHIRIALPVIFLLLALALGARPMSRAFKKPLAA